MINLNYANIEDWYMLISCGVKNGDREVTLTQCEPDKLYRTPEYTLEALHLLDEWAVEFGLNIKLEDETERFKLGRLARLYTMYSLQELRTLWDSKVLIIGCGGGGSMEAECFARNGVGHIVLVDGDIYNPHNLCSPVGAVLSNLGMPKPEGLAERVKAINDNIEVTYYNEWFSEDNYKKVMEGVTAIAVCCDNPSNKIGVTRILERENFPYCIAGLCVYNCWAACILDPSKYSYEKDLLSYQIQINSLGTPHRGIMAGIVISHTIAFDGVISLILGRETRNWFVLYDTVQRKFKHRYLDEPLKLEINEN